MRSLKELEAQQREGRIDLYYADESHICTEGYVPYGWQFPGEDVYIASGHSARMNIFGMINRKNNYKGFATTDSITADKVIEFLDALSFQVRKNTFVVLDNATIRNVADYMYAFAHECNSFQSLYFVQLLHYKECNVAGGKPKAGL